MTMKERLGASLVILRFPKVSRHPSCMDHALLHGKPFGILLYFLGTAFCGYSIVKSDMLFSRPSWLKSILKSGILFKPQTAVAKSIVKSGILFSHRPPWLKV